MHGDRELSAYCPGTTHPAKLAALDGVRILQEAEGEIRIAFKPAMLDQVAEVVRARRKRQLSPEERRQLSELGKKNLERWRRGRHPDANPKVDTEPDDGTTNPSAVD